jgi:hypothetical protein
MGDENGDNMAARLALSLFFVHRDSKNAIDQRVLSKIEVFQFATFS